MEYDTDSYQVENFADLIPPPSPPPTYKTPAKTDESGPGLTKARSFGGRTKTRLQNLHSAEKISICVTLEDCVFFISSFKDRITNLFSRTRRDHISGSPGEV